MKALLFGGEAEVPKDVAQCPECGGELNVRSMQWDSETGQPDGAALDIGCVDYLSHRWHQSTWQPVIDAVRKWAGAALLAGLMLLAGCGKPETFDAWMAKHVKTCSQCSASMDDPDVPICEVAFERLKAEASQ